MGECKECGREISKNESTYNKGLCTKCYMINKNQAKYNYDEEIMQEKEFCKKCNKEISNNESTKYFGYCQSCYEEKKQGTNKLAFVIKGIAIIGAIIGVCIGMSQFDSYKTEELGVPYIVISIISGIFIYALGEIIQLLEDIKNRTKE